MKSKVYLETTIVSYLVASPTHDIIQSAHQQITREWWTRRERFDLFVARPRLDRSWSGRRDGGRPPVEGIGRYSGAGRQPWGKDNRKYIDSDRHTASEGTARRDPRGHRRCERNWTTSSRGT